MDTGIDLKFADGEYHFALQLPHVFELERNCGGLNGQGVRVGKSIFQIYDELTQGLGLGDSDIPVYIGGGRANALDIRETIRLGLIGGGLAPIAAKQLIDDYCFPHRPMAESLGVAWIALKAAIEGVDVKKKPVTQKKAPRPKATNRSQKAQ